MDKTIWQATVDNGQFACEVKRIDERTGTLTVTEVSNGKVILSETVGLSYGAIFGPDMDDVADWEDKCIVAIDAR